MNSSNEGHLSVSTLQAQCKNKNKGLSQSGGKYEVVLRLLHHENGTAKKRSVQGNDNDGPVSKKTRAEKPSLEGEALLKRVDFRFKKLNKQIHDRLDWKSSFRYMNGAVKGARVDIDCSETEIFYAMFGQENVKESGNKLSRTFKTDQDLYDAGLHGRSYHYGANASLKAPASASLNNGKLEFSFKYTVEC